MQLLSILLHFPYDFTWHHWQCLHSCFPWTCSHWRKCGGAQEIPPCCPSRGAQGVPKAQGAFLSLMLSMRSGHLILLDLEGSHLNFDLLFEYMFIYIWKAEVDCNSKELISSKYFGKDIWFCFNRKFAQINLLPQFLFCWSSKEFSHPSPPKSSLLDKPLSESYWYWRILDVNDTHVERSNSELSLKWHSPVLADIIGLIILNTPLYFAIQRGWVLRVEPSLA